MASNGKDTNAAKPKLVDVLTRINKEGMSEAELKVIQAMLNKFGNYEKDNDTTINKDSGKKLNLRTKSNASQASFVQSRDNQPVPKQVSKSCRSMSGSGSNPERNASKRLFLSL